jgi:hypothetical protein
MTAEALLDGALLSLGAGATGFAFFDWLSLDDGGKILALSTAVALAAPFEDLFFEGEPLTQLDIVATENVLAWSGMQGQENKRRHILMMAVSVSLKNMLFRLGLIGFDLSTNPRCSA